MTKVGNVVEKVIEACGPFLIEREEHIKMLVLAVIAGGHVLIEGVPGVAKTLTAKSVAKALNLRFSRIQMTPDLLPADVIGTKIFDQKTGDFKIMLGPVHANVVLVDEINRASPRTQSALLEAMQEKQVTIEGEVFSLPIPFTVLATMNPIEVEGVFPLPEAQLDRFLMKLPMGGLSREGIRRLLRLDLDVVEEEIKNLKPVVSREDVLEAKKELREVWVDDSIVEYIIRVSEAVSAHRAVRLGLSPRGIAMLLLLSKALALADRRKYVIPDDVKTAALYVVPHRILIRPELVSDGLAKRDLLVKEIISKVEVPRP